MRQCQRAKVVDEAVVGPSSRLSGGCSRKLVCSSEAIYVSLKSSVLVFSSGFSGFIFIQPAGVDAKWQADPSMKVVDICKNSTLGCCTQKVINSVLLMV